MSWGQTKRSLQQVVQHLQAAGKLCLFESLYYILHSYHVNQRGDKLGRNAASPTGFQLRKGAPLEAPSWIWGQPTKPELPTRGPENDPKKHDLFLSLKGH